MDKTLRPPTVADLMIREVHTVSPDMSLDEAAAFLVKKKIPFAPVVERHGDSEELIGLISETDCLGYLSNELFYNNPDINVRSMMHKFPLCASPESDIFVMATIFTQHVYQHLPVVKDKQLLGVISRHDVLKAMHEFCQAVCLDKSANKSHLDFHELVNLRFIIK
jgi:predicted transcriptional regulator